MINGEALEYTEILQSVEQGKGYKVFTAKPSDLEVIRELVRAQYLSVLEREAPEYFSTFEQQPLWLYHVIASKAGLSHATIWSKLHRVFDEELLAKFKETDLYRNLCAAFGTFLMADEEALNYENVYWRLVRPGMPDVGPVHADKWFWDLGHGSMPEGVFRLKLWFAIYTQPGCNGLRVVPHSQKRDDWRYHSEYREGMNKPVIDHCDDELSLYDLPLDAGQFVLFHDRLLHGGMPNAGTQTRFSLEFTLLLSNELLDSME